MAEAAFDPDKYLAETAAPAASKNAPFDPDKYLSETAGEVPRGTNQQQEPGMFDKAVGFLANARGPGGAFFKGAQLLRQNPEVSKRVLDYPGGLVRTAAAYGPMDKNNIVKPEDWMNAIKGNAPSTSEYMERVGVPKGPNVDVPYLGNVSARGAAGLIGDVAMDPMIALAKGAPDIANPVGKLAEDAGATTYKSGFKKIDERLVEKGKTPLSEIMLENGAPAGTTKKIAGKAADLASDVGSQRAAAYDKATQLAGPVDLSQKAFSKAESQIASLRKSRFSADRDLADDLASHLDELRSSPADLHELSDIKTDLYNQLPKSAYDGSGKMKSAAQKYQKNLASDLRQTIIDHGNEAEPGLGDTIDKLNDKWSSLISAEKPMDLQIRRANTVNAITPIDAALSVVHPGAEAAKKAADLAKTTFVRTNVGKGLMKAGKNGAAQGLVNRAIIDENK